MSAPPLREPGAPPADVQADGLGGVARRAAPRDRFTCLVWLEHVGGGPGSGVARAVDLSPRGVGVVLPQPMSLDAPVLVDLLVPPTSLRLRTTGRVVHARQLDEGQWRVGVRFEHPPILVEGSER